MHLSSCSAVARRHAVSNRQEDLQCAQFPWSWLVLQCGRSTAAAGRRTTCSDGARLRSAVPITRARQQEWTGTPLACAARSASGLFLLRRPRAWSRASRSVGRPHPPQALGTRSHEPLRSSPPTALRTADRRSRSNAPARVVGVRALWQSVNQRPLSRWLVPYGIPWCCVLPYIRVKHASWFRALACVCPQTSPRRALSSLCRL